MKKTNLACAVIISSILGQNLAMAFDINRFQSLCPEAQQTRSLIRERISGMSENTKLKLSYKLYKVALKVLPGLEKMSDSDFNSKIHSSVENKTSLKGDITEQQDESLSKDDLQGVLPEDSSFQMSETSMAQIRNTHFNHSEITQQARNLIEQIGYKTDTNGNKKPLTRTEFNERALSYGMNHTSKQLRSIASIDLSTILELLLGVVIIGIAVGVIVMFGWMGLAIVFGGLIIYAIVWLIVSLSGPLPWSR